jgi:hypothetical protein
MHARIILGGIMFLSAIISAVATSVATWTMMDQVNMHLPEERQLSPPWHFAKTRRLHRESRKYSPKGSLPNLTRSLLALMFVLAIAGAWLTGIF